MEKNRRKTFPPFPIGWYAICDSEELPINKIIPFHAAGVDLAVWRGENGKPNAIDAYCPHLGANLAFGHVKGNCAVCPFHLWNFNSEGKCTEIFYTEKKIPNNAKVTGYPTIDWGHRVWFFYHPDKTVVENPLYELPKMEEFEGRYVVSGIKRDLKTHAWEILENCSDPIHFGVLHVKPWLPWPLTYIRDWMDMKVTHKKLECSEEQWTLIFEEEPQVSLFNHRFWLPNVVTVHIRFVGLTCHIFEFTIKGLGKATMITPNCGVERDIWYVDPWIPRFFIKYLQIQGREAFNEDGIAWFNKIFLKQPMQVQGDGLITKRRRWSQKFFSNMKIENLEW